MASFAARWHNPKHYWQPVRARNAWTSCTISMASRYISITHKLRARQMWLSYR